MSYNLLSGCPKNDQGSQMKCVSQNELPQQNINNVMDRDWTEDDILTDIQVEARERWIKQEIGEENIVNENAPQLISFEVDDVFEDSVSRPKNSGSSEQVENIDGRENFPEIINPLPVVKQEVTGLSGMEELERYLSLEECSGSRASNSCDSERREGNCELVNNTFASVFIKTEIKQEEAESSCRDDSPDNSCLSTRCPKTLYVRLVKLNIESNLGKPYQSDLSKRASGTHVCHLCPYSTNRTYHYKRHMATHMTFEQYAKSSTLYECNECNYKTKQKYSLKRHLVKVHKSAYVCQNCDYETNISEAFSLHLVSHHDNVLVYNCEKCNVSCSTKEQLKYHSKIHNLDKIILRCSECGFETKEMCCLDEHVLSHMHMRVGKMYKCEFCPYEAKKRSSISRHILTHEKVKKLQCNECGFKTKRKDSLAHHIRKHKTTK